MYLFFSVVPIARGICEYSFGIYSNGPCEKYYTKCVYGEPVDEPCTPGLAYDERSRSCNWPDLMEYCNPEGNLNIPCVGTSAIVFVKQSMSEGQSVGYIYCKRRTILFPDALLINFLLQRW